MFHIAQACEIDRKYRLAGTTDGRPHDRRLPAGLEQ
jgi:hypothetical protein